MRHLRYSQIGENMLFALIVGFNEIKNATSSKFSRNIFFYFEYYEKKSY